MSEFENGWRFYTADFSLQAMGNQKSKGSVTLVRCSEQRAIWHKLPEDVIESDDCPELYVAGMGLTIEDAIADANDNARNAKELR